MNQHTHSFSWNMNWKGEFYAVNQDGAFS